MMLCAQRLVFVVQCVRVVMVGRRFVIYVLITRLLEWNNMFVYAFSNTMALSTRTFQHDS